jgi:hypothetical protein
MKILLGDFNNKFGRQDTSKPTNVNESLLQGGNESGAII